MAEELSFVLFAIAVVCVALLILVLIGNLLAMKILARCGVAVFCSNIVKDSKLLHYINKDGLAWISIPEVCYAPVMAQSNGKYKTNNFLSKPSLYGELYLAEGDSLTKLKKIANIKDTYNIHDLSIIRGSAKGKALDMRQSNFSNLSKCREFVNSTSSSTDIRICENGVIRYFEVCAVIDKTVADLHSFKYTTRDAFVESLFDMASNRRREHYNINNDIVLLQCNTEIDTYIVVLVEKTKKKIGGDKYEKNNESI